MERYFRLAPLLVVAFLTACPSDVGPGGGAPQITSFTATPTSISTPGQAVTLSWQISGSVTDLELEGVGPVAGSSTIVYPNATTTYTLTASNSSGSNSRSTTVTLGTGGGELVEDGLPPTLTTFGVSLTQTDFQNDQGGDIESPTDPRIVRVQPGGTFYAVVSATDPGGIASVTPFLANSSPPGLRADLVQGQSVGGFTLVGEVGGCILDGTQTAVTCIYEIAVGNIPNIDELEGAGSEFAYVFRTRVTDNAGLVSDVPPRGYVIVGSGGGDGTPTPPTDPNPPTNPNPPGTPNPPANRAPNADFTFQQQEGTLTVAFSGARSSDPDGDSLSYRWNFGDGTNSTARDFRKTYSTAGNKQVSLTVTDPDGASDTETKTVTVAAPGGGGGGGGGGDDDDTFTLTVTKEGSGSGTVTATGINCGSDCTEDYDAGTPVTLTAAAANGSTFASWGGDCSGETCRVTMSEDRDVTATFNPVSTVLRADAGPNAVGTVGQSVTLDGSDSTGATSYSWAFKSTPTGNTATIRNVTRPSASFTPNVAGPYTVTLTVSRGTETDTDDVTINVSNATTPAPDADAGDDRTTTVNVSTTLDGTGSENAASYLWQVTTTEPGSTPILATPTGETTTFVTDVAGDYVVTLTVRDVDGARPNTDRVEITVNP